MKCTDYRIRKPLTLIPGILTVPHSHHLEIALTILTSGHTSRFAFRPETALVRGYGRGMSRRLVTKSQRDTRIAKRTMEVYHLSVKL